MLFVTSLFACILSFHNIVSRYIFTLAGRGVLPTALGDAHAKHGSPSRASLTASVTAGVLIVIAALLGLDPIGQFYTWLGGISSVGIVLLLVLTSVAVLAIFRRNDHGLGRWKTLIAPGLGLIGLAAFAVLVFQNLPVLVAEPSYGPFSMGHHRAVRGGVRARPDRGASQARRRARLIGMVAVGSRHVRCRTRPRQFVPPVRCTA